MANRVCAAAACFLLLCALAAAAETNRVALVLRTGERVTGVVTEDGFDEGRGLTLVRDDNGGLLRLRWDQIRDRDVARIKAQYGFTGDEVQPVLIHALRVVTPNGEVVGLEEGREGDDLLVRQRDNVVRIPIGSIRRIETVQVDALDVEDPMRLFERRRREEDPRAAVEWYNLALYAESLTLFEQAKSCLQNVLDLDPGFSKRGLIEQRLKLLDVKLAEREETRLLLQIQSLKTRSSYDKAWQLAEEFLQQYPSSRQIQAVQREKADIAERRTESLLRQIRADFFTFFNRLATDTAANRDLPLGDAMTWAREEAFVATIDRLETLYALSEQEVVSLWAKRGKQGSPQSASYGGGTFILGEAARKGLELKKEEEEVEEAAEPGNEKTLQDRIKEKLKEKAEADKKKRSEKADTNALADVPPTPEEWWATASPTDRRGFLQAFFAEHAGQVEIERLSQRDCSMCYGKGILEYYAVNRVQGNLSGEEPCPRCKFLGFDRIVTYR